jgi:UDP-glucose 4-epimerase/UDP-arabinose 4-epimerase
MSVTSTESSPHSLAVLVTGGAGYVGAHTCKALRRVGYTPIVFDDLSTGHESFVRWGPLIRADIRDSDALADTIGSYDVAAVLHFAASASVRESVVNPQKYYENNVDGTLSLLRAMFRAGCTKIVFSSSCAVYGEPNQGPISEETPSAPVNPYGASKAMIERILSDYARAHTLNFVALRYFNACGADPDGDIGELRDPETHLIPRAMMALQGYIGDFEVFGTDYATPDGTAVRDYVHVCDLADAHVTSVRRLLGGGASGVYNLGTGRGYSVKQVLAAIELKTGEHLRVKIGPRRPGDPPVLVADAWRAKTDLDFKPKLSELETIVATAWAWHQRAHRKRLEILAAG